MHESPKSPFDFNADPERSSDSDDLRSGDIPSSFNADGRTRNPKDLNRKPSPQKRQPARLTDMDRASDKPSFKRLKVEDDDDIFADSVLSKSRNRQNYKTFQRPAAAYAYAARTMSKSASNFKAPPRMMANARSNSSATFKSPYLTPKSSSKDDDSSQEKGDSFKDAEDYLREPAKFDTETTPKKSNRKGAKVFVSLAPTTDGNKGKRGFHQPRSANNSPPRSSAPEFKIPETLTQVAARIDPEELKREIEEERRREAEQQANDVLPDEGPCPMRCGKILKREQLETLDPKASIREQQAFCRKHQVKDAEEEWQQKGYPKINWERLRKRLKRHDKDIAKMIKHPDRLWYRKEMEERNKKGKDRTIMQHLENEGLQGIGVGYYGPKGCDVMTDYITRQYATDIRERAVSDKIIHGRGATGYVQMVLVLELTALLVKEDMRVDDETARRIMSESTAIGDLLHPSEGGKARSWRGRIEVGGEDSLEGDS
jgi:hypothetical protein